jgi:hypothetical protein
MARMTRAQAAGRPGFGARDRGAWYEFGAGAGAARVNPELACGRRAFRGTAPRFDQARFGTAGAASIPP